jgi:hypothetical protein
MGFGSYTESDKERQEMDTTEIDIQEDTRGEFEGDMAFDPGANTDDLISQLGEIKDNKNQQE